MVVVTVVNKRAHGIAPGPQARPFCQTLLYRELERLVKLPTERFLLQPAGCVGLQHLIRFRTT